MTVVTRLRDVVFDTWTAWSFKAQISEGKTGGTQLAPTWVGEVHRRRLSAYTLCRAYIDNAARTAIDLATDVVVSERQRSEGQADAQRSIDAGVATADRREYGDAALLVNAVADAVLGEDVAVVVPGAAEEPPTSPHLPPEPDPAPPEASVLAQRVAEVSLQRWTQAGERSIAQWIDDLAAYDAAVDRQEWLRRWAEDERLILKLIELEGDAVGLGDAVAVVGWSNEKGRPVVEIYDPGVYFPVIDPNSRDEYPRTVHLAWEYEQLDADGKTRSYVRRITWRLSNDNAEREYPWRPGQLSTTACRMTDATWRLEDLVQDRGVDGFAGSARYLVNELNEEVRDLDIGVDFIPVVHIPNTPARKEHFGQSLIASVAQILDDLQSADTDAAAASRLAGSPMAHVGGSTAVSGTLAVAPGTVFTGGDRMTVLDMSQPLRAVMERIDKLLDRLSVNSQVIAEALGRVKSSDVPSGITVALMFGPMRRVVRKLRLVRGEKYPILLEFVQRFAQHGGTLSAGENPRAEVAFGSFLPYDQKGLVDMIVALLANKGVSRHTTLRWMAENGFDLENLSEELAQLQSEDFDSADKLALILGPEEAADYLGRAAPAAPTIVLPPPPPASVPPTPAPNPLPPVPPV
jgi:hypothetical protein